MLTAPREFHYRGEGGMIVPVTGEFLPVGKINPLDEEIPDERIFEPVLLIGREAVLFVPREDVVNLKSFPDIGKIVKLFELGDVKPSQSVRERCFS